MNTRILLPAAAPSLIAIALALSSVRCDKDPPTRCGMGSGPALARYYLVSGPKDVQAGSGACDALLMNGSSLPASGTPLPVSGEAVATEEYLPNQADPSVTNSVHRSMAIEPLWIINRIQDAELNEGDGGNIPADSGLLGLSSSFSDYPYTGDSGANPMPALPPDDAKNTDRPYAWGFFDALYPDSKGICTAQLNPSVIDLPEIPAHTVNWYSSPDESAQGVSVGGMEPDQPATHVEYTWTNVRTLQTGSSVGQQMWADLTITRDGCTASYHVALLSPQTPCATFDDAGNQNGADLSQCSATAMPNVPNPTTNQLYGSGLPVGVPFDCVDINALPAGFDAGGDGGGGGSSSSPDYECVLTNMGP
jgi:hypothetical protein